MTATTNMQALDIISAEHRGMWRLASALDGLGAQLLADPQSQGAAPAVVAMLDYLQAYTDRLHHPKEDQFLFRLLRQRSSEAEAHIARLEGDHRHGPAYLERLLTQARALESGAAIDMPAFCTALKSFVSHQQAHIRLEETTVMPLARRVLTTEDWREANAAFAANDDPLFGAAPRAEFAALHARIVRLAPDPYGLGGAAEPLPAMAATASPKAATAAKVLEVRDLTSHYGRIQALKGIHIDVYEGQLVALVGANGAGKTTLLRTLSGVQPASGGDIVYRGASIVRQRPDARVRAGICQVPEGRQVFGPLAIEDNLRLGAYTRPKAELAEDLDKAYTLFPILAEKRKLPAGTLSGGQQQMLAMARALMARPRLLLLDEPSMGLAPLLIEEIFRVVKTLRAQGMTILLVEQNAHAALSIADVGYVLETGSISLSGPGQELLRNEQVKKAYLGM
jgi:branched-chain amino acid transport system ATP-binding protein